MKLPRALSRPVTMDASGQRNWLYPQKVTGYFSKRREWVSWALLLFYLAVPWVRIDGLPALKLDIVEQHFIIWGTTYWPQDVKYLVFVLIGAAILLFFVTSLAGRLWCGWACPQTVFLEFVFHRIENLIEGDRNKRIALDKGPWNAVKIGKKLLKHAIFLAVGFVIANTFLAYFKSTEEVLEWIGRPPYENWGAFLFMLANFVVFYLNFAWFREQFCTILCPYARFQSALVDKHTLQVTYDYNRGEPRGKVKKAEGDCIDCKACIRVCPTGIDIRNGVQLECIGCTNCIDACDNIMERINKPKGLIRYSSEAQMEDQQQRLIRPRVVIYASFLVILSIGFFWSLAVRPLVEFTIIRAPGEPYTLLEGKTVSNHLSLRLLNKDQVDHNITVKVSGAEDARLIVPVQPFPLPANSLKRMELFVNIPQANMPSGKQAITLLLFSDDREIAESSTFILGPIL
ncbi:MAG: cytochrome c oxidase accessory protein CcoG [SAR324 cluster bacterium]|nr:cytochrome c oxidase accessory protein CcoG [SAR324 cluster bacterium]